MGSDLFTTKCEAHNYVVPYRSSCPICVSAKRSQLHAANLAHMPRYLFEQKLNTACDETGLHKPWQAKPLPCDVRWKTNFKSNHLALTYSKLESTTQALLMALDVTTDSELIKKRHYYQKQIDDRALPTGEQERMLQNLAIDMYYEIVRVTKGNREACSHIAGQFMHHFKLLYGNGQRLVKTQPGVPEPVPLVPSSTATYQLNFTSLYGSSSLNHTTHELLRKLDKYEGTLGQLRMDHQKIIASLDKQSPYYQQAVKAMAVVLWNRVSLHEDREMSMKVRDQFLGQVEYLYALGQRLKVVKPLPALKAGLHDLVDCLYDYLVTSSKELYHEQVLLEKDLDTYQDNHDRKVLIGRYRTFAYRVGDAYMKDKMYDCHRVDIFTIFKLQERLADAYLAGERR